VLATCRSDQKIDRTDIDAFRAAGGSEASSGGIGLSFQLKQRVGVQESQQPVELFRRPETIEKFLEDVADQEQPIA